METLPRFRGKEEKPSPLDALLTVSEFRRLSLEALRCYHRARLKRYRGTQAMVGVEPRPIELLKWGRKHLGLQGLSFPLEQARLQLLPGGEATVTPEGIRFQKVFYTSQRAVQEGWYERARRDGDYRIQVAFDPRLVDRIFLRGPKTTTLEACVLTEADQRRFKGWCWEEVKEFLSKDSQKPEGTPTVAPDPSTATLLPTQHHDGEIKRMRAKLIRA